MGTAIKLGDYLAEIRREVCSHCIERPPGGPPCAPLGKQCGVEMHLRELVDAIHQVRSGLIEPYLRNNREKICSHCPLADSSSCPCPMDDLAVLVVEAVEAVDERGGASDDSSAATQERTPQARVTLTVKEGTLKGRQFVFDLPSACLIGRAPDCSVQLLSDCLSGLISRHHCRLEVDPPAARLRDLGSLNGTYVNGLLIGRRSTSLTAEEANTSTGPAYELADGDEIGVGAVVFQVSVHGPPAGVPEVPADACAQPTMKEPEGEAPLRADEEK